MWALSVAMRMALKLPQATNRPGQIDNSKLVSAETISGSEEPELRRTLIDGEDYILVPQQVWRRLLQWYLIYLYLLVFGRSSSLNCTQQWKIGAPIGMFCQQDLIPRHFSFDFICFIHLSVMFTALFLRILVIPNVFDLFFLLLESQCPTHDVCYANFFCRCSTFLVHLFGLRSGI